MRGERPSVLFLCTGNSARSIMAEAIANGRYGDRLAAASAGSRPLGHVHEQALQTLRAHGVTTEELRSKSWDEVRDRPFALVITLCASAAAEACPTFPGAPRREHWGLPDPPKAEDPRACFELVFRTLDAAIARLAEAGADLGRAARSGREVVEAARAGGTPGLRRL